MLINHLKKSIEDIGIKAKGTVTKIDYEIESEFGNLVIHVNHKEKESSIDIFNENKSKTDLIKKSAETLSQTLQKELGNDYKITLSRNFYPYQSNNQIPLKNYISIQDKYLNSSYEILNLELRTTIAFLEYQNIKTIKDILSKSKADLMEIPYLGEPNIERLVEKLKKLA